MAPKLESAPKRAKPITTGLGRPVAGSAAFLALAAPPLSLLADYGRDTPEDPRQEREKPRPPRPASRARPPPPPPGFRTRLVSTRAGRVRKMIPVSVCGACRPEVLAALTLIQHRCDIVNTLVEDPAGFFCHSMSRQSERRICGGQATGHHPPRGAPPDPPSRDSYRSEGSPQPATHRPTPSPGWERYTSQTRDNLPPRLPDTGPYGKIDLMSRRQSQPNSARPR